MRLNYASRREPSALTRSLFPQPVKLATPEVQAGPAPSTQRNLCLTEGNSSHYQVLRIPVTATDKDIKVAYRKAARTAHPDHGGDAAMFRRVTLAYETLIDATAPRRLRPLLRQRHRLPAARPRPRRCAFRRPGRRQPCLRPCPPPQHAAQHRRRRSGLRSVLRGVAAGGGVPLIPESTARQQVHGMPRKRGIFGAEARIQREMRTVQLITRQVLPAIPAARLINGLQSPADNSHIDHVLSPATGWRSSVPCCCPRAPTRGTASTLNHGGRSIAPPQLAHVVRADAGHLPGAERHRLDGGPQHRRQPARTGDRPARPLPGPFRSNELVQVVNAAGLVRGLKQFLSSGPAPNTVNVPVLARLLRGMH